MKTTKQLGMVGNMATYVCDDCMKVKECKNCGMERTCPFCDGVMSRICQEYGENGSASMGK